MHEVGATQDKPGISRTIYGTKIIPLLEIKTTTQKTTISAGTICKSFIATPYRRAEIESDSNCKTPSADATDQHFPIQFTIDRKFVAYLTI
jgi:hypothetical protein